MHRPQISAMVHIPYVPEVRYGTYPLRTNPLQIYVLLKWLLSQNHALSQITHSSYSDLKLRRKLFIDCTIGNTVLTL